MGSLETDELNQPNQSSVSDTETQSPHSISSSGEETDGGNRLWLGGDDDAVPPVLGVETHLMNLDFETQVVDETDCDEDEGGSDGGGTDRTEVLSDMEDECEMDGGGNRKSEQSGKELVVDSGASVDGKLSAGSTRKSFMSVRIAALRLRASGNSTAHAATFNRTGDELRCTNSDITSVKENICEDDRSASTSFGNSVKDGKRDHDNSNLSQSMHVVTDETKCNDVKPVVGRQLLFEDAAIENNGPANENEITDGGRDFPELLAFNQDLAGLSYVGSQEPGDQSQINALDIVDKFLLVTDVNVSQEVRLEKSFKDKTPPVSKAKGSHYLAKRISVRSPSRDNGTFDWEDMREDEGGGKFFCKTKEAFFGSSCHERISETKPKNHRHLNLSKGHSREDGLEESNLGKKIMGLNHPGSTVILENSETRNNVVEISEVRGKSLLQEFDEPLNVDTPEQQSEATGTSKDLPDMHDVGFDTQMAAEALEDLFLAPPANPITDDLDQVANTVVDGSSVGVTKKKASLKHVSVRKTPSSDSRRMSTLPKRTNITKSSNETSVTSMKDSKHPRTKNQNSASTVKTKGKKGKRKAEYDFKSGDVNLVRRSSRPVEHINIVESLESFHKKETSRSPSSSTPSGQLSRQQEDCSTFTPIACRTRRSAAVNPLKRRGLSTKAEEETLNRANYPQDKSSTSLDGDTPFQLPGDKFSSKPGSKQICKVSEQEPLMCGGLHEEIATTSYEYKDALSNHPRGKRTRRKKPILPNTVSDLYGQPILTVEESSGEHTRRKRPKFNVVGSCFTLGIKGNRQSSVTPHPSDPAISSLSIVSKRHVQKDNADSLLSAEVGKESNNTSKCNVVNVSSKIRLRDDHNRKLCKKSISGVPLLRELISLDATGTTINHTLDSRRRRDMANVRVLFSHHLDGDIIKQQQKISARLGVSVVFSSYEATHFVTDKFARTRNMLEAMALGKPVVTHLWLESCGQAGCFIDEKKYIVRDHKKEKELGFSMPVSLARARESPLLQGKSIFITPNITPSKEMISSLVTMVHGQVVARIKKSDMKDNKIRKDMFILSCEEDYSICAPFSEIGAAIYTSELLLSGIVTQKLEYERYRLFADHTKRIQSTK